MTNKVLDILEKDAKTKGTIDAIDYLSHFTLDVLGLSIFDYDFKSLDGKLDEYYESYRVTIGQVNNPIRLLAPWLEKLPLKSLLMKKGSFKLADLFAKIIKERKENCKGKTDILTHLILASESNNQGLSEDELMANTLVLFIAGHETTATALSWILYELYKNPKIQQKLYEEIIEHIGDKKEPEFDDWDKLTYLNNVITESLRLHPPVSHLITRRAVEDVDFEGVHIPKDSRIGIDIYNIHLDPDNWENPFEFNPDRFLPENKKKIDRFAYLPFSLGPRQCIGNTFSLIEQHLFVMRLLQRFEILPPKDSVNTLEKKTHFNSPSHMFISLRERVK